MKTNLLVFFSISLIISSSTNLRAQKNSLTKPEYYKVSEVRIYINEQSDIFELRKQGLGFEHIKLHDNYFDALLDSFQIDKLKKSGYLYEIIIDDVTKDYLERTKDSREKIKLNKPCKGLGFGFGSMGGFYTLDEVIAQLDTMRLLYPNLITEKDSIGSAIEGRPIWAVKISDNPEINEEEPEVFYNSLTHAREPAGMMTVVYFMYYLLENYGVDPEVTYLVNNREFYFVPVINPDGYVYNQQISPNGGGMWRKNVRSDSTGLFGVDMNRNYSYMWGYDNIGSSPFKLAEDYRGTTAFSEPETQVIRKFCINHNFLICNNYHTYGNVTLLPWGYNDTHTPDSSIFNNLIEVATSFNQHLNGLALPPGHVLNYTTNGDANDWMYGDTSEKNKIFAILPEVGNENDGFWPVPERIFPIAEENLYANLIYAWGVGVIDNPPYISDASLNLRYCRPLLDSVKICAFEKNPDNHTSNVFAKVTTSNDSLIREVQLIQSDSIFTVSLFPNSAKEEFYKINLQQNGIDIPSKIFLTNRLRFTTAGPVVLDSITWSYNSSFKYYVIKPYIHNNGNDFTISNPLVEITSGDSWITSILGPYTYPSLPPGGTTTGAMFRVIVDSTFPGYFNFKARIGVDGWYYWVDSITIVTNVEEEQALPISYGLYQNYPNPFNPSTKIKYSIQQASQVQVKVFDVLGNEIETLVNEEKPTGTYELTWNAANLPSGVYFYQLKARDFINTKKMILMK
ncbi:MAG: hypothetical protein A2W30_02685 [Ignavibacteria bacterium RBG_16_36_9]|nr:MAG: hypothetical protein A2W30_02685 [Ignavibacteria bacterium RBG_16_36_9]